MLMSFKISYHAHLQTHRYAQTNTEHTCKMKYEWNILNIVKTTELYNTLCCPKYFVCLKELLYAIQVLGCLVKLVWWLLPLQSIADCLLS